MSTSSVRITLLAAAALAACPSARAEQDVKPAAGNTGSVHRLEITNGSTRTVHLVGTNVAPADKQRLRDLERAENDVALANKLQGLRMSYLNHENRMERRRFDTNYRLAGITHAYNPGIYADLVPIVDPRILYDSDYGWGYRYGGYGWGGGSSGYAYGGYVPQTTGADSMYANSFIAPGPLQTELVKGLVARATPEFADQANRDYRAALSRANQSEAIAKALGRPADDIQPASAEVPREIVMKNNDKFSGTVVKRDSDWVVLDTDTGRVEVRTSEIAQIRSKK